MPAPTARWARPGAPVNRSARNLDLCRRYQAGDASAAEELLSLNSGLVGRAAKRQARFCTGMEFEDLYVEGQLGLLRAARGFDPNRGVEFSTYAVPWVRQAVGRAIETQDRLIRLPVQKIRDGEQPVCDVSLDALAGEHEDTPLGDLLPAPNDTERDALGKLFVEAALDLLKGKERLVTEGRLEGITLQEIAERVRMSREGVRHVERRALARLREALFG